MAKHRSFKEYISDKFYNQMFGALKSFVITNRARLDLRSNIVSNIDFIELSDFTVKAVGIDDREGTGIAFDVAVEAELEVTERSSRKGIRSDACSQWFLLCCEGDLSKGVSSFKVNRIEVYNQMQMQKNPLTDTLIPYTSPSSFDDRAEEILKKYYPESLEKPRIVDPMILAQRVGLSLLFHGIAPDGSAFGKLFFADTEDELYDSINDRLVSREMKEGTVVVDPSNFFFRNLGSVNFTIAHEVVHWLLHKKVFMLEKLYNPDARQIQCQVYGGVRGDAVRSETEVMEWQANKLAPRLLMPRSTFRAKVNELIAHYKRIYDTQELIEIIEPVIEDLATFFGVSRTAAKIRMIDVGFEAAMGAFNYIDGKTVPTHIFKKGAIKRNQTYSIGAEDLAYTIHSNKDIRDQMESGAYVYVESHLCVNSPDYITISESGGVRMTEYARTHIDECCIAFELTLKHKTKFGQKYYTECALYRGASGDVEFTVSFAPNVNDDVISRASALSNYYEAVNGTLRALAPLSFGESLAHLMKESKVTVETLAWDTGFNEKTISRMRNDPTYPKSIESVIAVCVALHLPPLVSQCLLDKTCFKFQPVNNEAHFLYKIFIESMYNETVEACNKVLEVNGHAPLND